MKKNLPAHGRRVVGYVRISRNREEETSTTTQAESIKAYCAAHGWLLVDIITEPGQSAFKASRSRRPGFRKAMGLIAAGAADTFMVWKLDRAARNTLDLLKFVQEDLAVHDAQFVSVTESFDTSTPMGRAMLTIVAALAELESAQKQERALEWHEHRRANRMTRNGPAPRGYVKVGPNRIEPDPVVGPMVADAIQRVNGGESLRALVKEWEDAGVSITTAGLRDVLRNPTIAGLRSSTLQVDAEGRRSRYVTDLSSLVPGDWEPLVDRAEWERALVTLTAPTRRTNGAQGNRLRYPLRPLIQCGGCGSPMRVALNAKVKYAVPRYVCEGSGCKVGISQEPVDEMVTDAVLAFLNDSRWRSMRATGNPVGPDPVQVQADLARMWELVLARQLDIADYTEAKALWEGQLYAATQPSEQLPQVDSLREAWPTLDAQARHVVFRRAIASLTVAPATRRGRGTDLSRVSMVLR